MLLSGHHDTWHYGVMDNGAANATMLEAARLLARERPAWRRGLRVCFWSGHSHGRYSGSAWYADEHWLELERRCAAHVNVDFDRRHRRKRRDQLRRRRGARALGRRCRACRNRTESRRATPSPRRRPILLGHRHPLDVREHQPSAARASEDAHRARRWWHTPHDLIDKIDEENLVRDTRIVLGVLWRL